MTGLITDTGDQRLIRQSTAAMRTAPVSREMVLNFVATHSLGLPQSY